MAIPKEQLEQILGKARDLCNPEGDALVESRMRGQDPDPSSYGDYDEFDRMYLNEDEDYYQQQRMAPEPKDIRYNQMTASNSRLPENIKQSMLENVISVNPLADIDLPPKQKPRKQQITEQQQYQQPQVSGVDYSIIKAIVNECLNDYFSRQPLNENNSLTTIGLKSGVIKLVDNKGNVYSAKLEKIGNTNK